MKLSMNWLRDWVNTELSTSELAEHLTLAGLEVEGIEPVAPPGLDAVVAAKILSSEPHPNADRLKICRVDDGSGCELQIVCGAPNARAGMLVPLAPVGARLPGDLRIRKSKIRGVESYGMLCSGQELGMVGSDGLLELDAAGSPGEKLSVALGLDDEILEISLTPNRGDCLSIAGVARDLACVLDTELKVAFNDRPVTAQTSRQLQVRVECAQDCSTYAGRVIEGLNPEAQSPLWMRERLRRSGLRSINPLVDVTNYVLLELGQPMHAFDLDKLQGGLGVRRGRVGETLRLLNEQSIELSADELLITDDSGPVALAGAMGGLGTAVTNATCNVFLESACFAPAAVAGTGRKFKLSSDSLHRYERGVDPDLQLRALERATALLTKIAGGRVGPVVRVGAPFAGRQPVTLRLERLARLLGSAVPADRVRGILGKLGCQVRGNDAELQVTPPSCRYDISIEEDLIEEVARIYGYASLPGRVRHVPQSLRCAVAVSTEDRVRAALVQRAYHEAATLSFVDPEVDKLVSQDLPTLMLDNPMSTALAQMRTTLWSSLLPVWQHNVQRQQPRVRLFELARSYGFDKTGALYEVEQLAGIVSGLAQYEQWGIAKRELDFFDVKGDLEAVLGSCVPGAMLDWRRTEHPALHPGISAALVINGQLAGHLGLLHPARVKALELPAAPYLFELQLSALERGADPVFGPVADFPSVRRDLALLVPDESAVGAMIASVSNGGYPSLERVWVFDLYRDKGLPNGFKSVALGLIFQGKSRTLTDGEVDAVVAGIASGLESEFGARIRD